MKVGFKFFRGDAVVTYWTTPGKQGQQRDAPITSVRFAYSDTEISQATITFQGPSENFQRAMLAKVIAEPTPIDQEVTFLMCSIWVQHPRFGIDPLPIFVGLPLDLQFKAGSPDEMTITIHDFSRLQNIQRDLQDFQNLSDAEIAITLMERLQQSVPGVIKEIEVDQKAIREYRTTASYGSVRRWNASLLDPGTLASNWEKLVKYCTVLGLKVSRQTYVDQDTGQEKVRLNLVPIGTTEGLEPTVSKEYRRGDGEVLSFSATYTPPSAVMTRNVMDRRFDPYMEAWRLERARCGTKIQQDGIITTNTGQAISAIDVTSIRVPVDQKTGKPLSTSEYKAIAEPMFKNNVLRLGWGSTAALKDYQTQIAARGSIFMPGTNPVTTTSPNGSSAVPSITVQESRIGQGALFWRFTGKLQVVMNPLLTTTDYLKIRGFGLWDGTWAIRSITHDIALDSPKTTFDLTFGDPVRISQ